MRVYLDICCIKRPFDDQSQERIAQETAAVLAILDAAMSHGVSVLRSSALDLENSRNSNPARAAAVRELLASLDPPTPTPQVVRDRAASATIQWLGAYDSLHLAWAEHLGADMFVTVDDALMRRAARLDPPPRVRVVDPAGCLKEIMK